MRCPYCQGLNPDTARFCVRCGRDFPARTQQGGQPYVQKQAQAQPATNSSGWPITPPAQPFQRYQAPTAAPQPAMPPVETAPPKASKRQRRSNTREERSHEPATKTHTNPGVPQEPACPQKFPPRTPQELLSLVSLAQNYTLISDISNRSKKRELRIAYHACPSWQQVATLLKVLQDHNSMKHEKIVIQGFIPNSSSQFLFDNGQLVVDRNARLGNQTFSRYLFESHNGYSNQAIRIVISDAPTK